MWVRVVLTCTDLAALRGTWEGMCSLLDGPSLSWLLTLSESLGSPTNVQTLIKPWMLKFLGRDIISTCGLSPINALQTNSCAEELWWLPDIKVGSDSYKSLMGSLRMSVTVPAVVPGPSGTGWENHKPVNHYLSLIIMGRKQRKIMSKRKTPAWKRTAPTLCKCLKCLVGDTITRPIITDN